MELFTTFRAKISLLRTQLAAGEVDALVLQRAHGNIQLFPCTSVSSVVWLWIFSFPGASQHLSIRICSAGSGTTSRRGTSAFMWPQGCSGRPLGCLYSAAACPEIHKGQHLFLLQPTCPGHRFQKFIAEDASQSSRLWFCRT